jgi:hypothetical protein
LAARDAAADVDVDANARRRNRRCGGAAAAAADDNGDRSRRLLAVVAATATAAAAAAADDGDAGGAPAAIRARMMPTVAAAIGLLGNDGWCSSAKGMRGRSGGARLPERELG